MLGYVVTEKSELKMREYEIYSGYYCGICKSIGNRLGQIPRLVLSYDAAFLALLLSSLSDEREIIEREHCIAHPIQKKTIIYDNKYIDYGADIMVILAYHNFKDDVSDEKSILGSIGQLSFKRYYKKLEKQYEEMCSCIEGCLKELSRLEEEKCNSLDRIGENFAIIMEKIFSFGPVGEENRRQLSVLGKHLGKWIYLIDAVDDLFDDMKSKSYNPLIYRFSFDEKEETKEGFWQRIKPTVEFNLFQYLSQIAAAFDLLDIKKNKGIIENVIFMGLRRKTETILQKGIDIDE